MMSANLGRGVRSKGVWKFGRYIRDNLGTSTMPRQVTGLKISSTTDFRTQLYESFILSVVTKVTMQRARGRRPSLMSRGQRASCLLVLVHSFLSPALHASLASCACAF